MYLVTAKQMQNIDRAAIQSFGIPGQVLMENAGRGAVEMFLRTFPYIKSKRVSILAGRGNNGGDGFVMARYLMEKGFEVKTFLFSTSDRVTGDAKAN
ncbi:MAG: NAD(P)H-hydrate epimerase, partial [Desulfamplus sp.]